MSILKVAHMGHPVLRAKARALDKHEIKLPGVQAFIDDMIDTMHEDSGVGLAAPQVHQSLRLFVALLDADGRGEGDAVALINPEITVVGTEQVEGWEEVVACHALTGDMAYLLHVYVADLPHFSRFLLDRLLNDAGVADANSSFVLRTVKRSPSLPLGQLEP